MRVLMSGGGTAGHIYPALTVAEHLVAEHDEVLFVGTPDGLESRIVPEAAIEFAAVPATGFDRSRPFSLLVAVAVALASLFKARAVIAGFKPDVVIGFGGYVSIPVGLAAVVTRTPLVLHEQNSVPGLANRLLSRWARRVGVTYDSSRDTLRHPERVLLTGNPVRSAVLQAERTAGRGRLAVPLDATLLLVFGGSRGARHLNTALTRLRERLLAIPDLHVLHVAGRAEADAVQDEIRSAGGGDNERWKVVDYIEHMGDALAAADLVLARAGATSIAEITALGRPAILIPYPYATDDHQTLNALSMMEAGAAVIVPDSDLDSPVFAETLERLLTATDVRDTMAAASRVIGRPEAGRAVVNLARAAVRGTPDA